jgi:argininosuccinate lyase
MPFRQAHEIVAAMVRRLIGEGRDFSSLTLKEWKEASDFFGDDAPQAATPLESVYAKRTPQSTNPDAVQAVLMEFKDWLNPKSQ